MGFRRRHEHSSENSIPEKANRALNLILVLMVLLLFRMWHLAVIQYDSKLVESRKPQKRTVIEPARRATIRDRFNIPLAINKIQYNAAILYSQLRTIPAVSWEVNKEGKPIKRMKRKEYITALSQRLAKELQLDSERLEDLIHSKAALYDHRPFLIKEDISEKEYYRLKMLEKDFPGIHMQRVSKRTYPQGRVGADIIGYTGAINREEYERIIGEIKALEESLTSIDLVEEHPFPLNFTSLEQVEQRLKQLRELDYSITDYVGKSGVEAYFEKELRGFRGKRSYYSDAKGNFLRLLPGSKDPQPGHKIKLTISAELQDYAETLLIQNERIREAQPSHAETYKQPWIKGGAIVALDPHSGELLALASYPRYNPNDFISSGNPDLQLAKRSHVIRWLENEEYIAQIWNQKRPLERERYDDEAQQFYEDTVWLSWDRYITTVVPPNGTVKSGLSQIANVKNAVSLQKRISTLLEASGQSNLYWLFDTLYPDDKHQPFGKRAPLDVQQAIRENLELHPETMDLISDISPIFSNIPLQYDKVLLVDLCQVAIDEERFSPELVKSVATQTLSQYRDASAALATISSTVSSLCKTLFHNIDFQQWRKEQGQPFLKQKRLEEKEAHQYAKPYIDYLDAKENALFKSFWEQQRWQLIACFLLGNKEITDSSLQPYMETLTQWNKEISTGAHHNAEWFSAYSALKNALATIPSLHLASEYLQTLRSFYELKRPLYGRYRHLRKQGGKQLEKHLASAFYPRYGYGYGRSFAYRQATIQGSIFKLVPAYAALLQQGTTHPLEMSDSIHWHKELCVGYHADGTSIPQHYKGGRLPKSCLSNIGKLDLIRALEYSSNPYFALLAGDVLKKPTDLTDAARAFSFGARTGIELPGEIAGKVPDDVEKNRTGLYSLAIGQHTLVVTPLQTSLMLAAIANGGNILKPQIILEKIDCAGSKRSVQHTAKEVRKEIPMPHFVRTTLLKGMERASHHLHECSLGTLSRFYKDYPEAVSDFVELDHDFVGKTSTAEAIENIDLDLDLGTDLYTHVWFGAISFEATPSHKQTFVAHGIDGKPELIVVVYLKFGKFGKEAAPLAAQVIHKWREIKQKHKS